MQAPKDKTLFYSTLILVIVHTCGVIGLLSPYRELFLKTTPVNIILSALLLYLNHRGKGSSFLIFCLVGYLFGYAIEVVGSRTGMIFGEYSYGNALGMKVMEVPVVMGLNWLMLVYSAGIICDRINTHYIGKSLIGASMLVILDLFLEPVAIRFDFWTWAQGSIPVQNYIAWYCSSFLLLLLFYGLSFKKENSLAKALFLVQFVFFILLNIL